MVRIFRRAVAFVICAIGVALPWRARVLYSEALGWLVQGVYLGHIRLLQFLLRRLEPTRQDPGGPAS